MLTIVKKNDSYDAITYQLENEDNSTVDLTGASVNFVMGKKNKLITNAKATVTSATSGIVSYQLTPLDTLVSGTFLAEFVVTFANGTTKTYPSNGYITVDVEQNLDTSQANVVVDMIAEKQGDFTSKLNSILLQAGNINMSAMNEYSWTATEGQLVFTFPSSINYTPSTKWFQVSVGNVPVDNTLVNRSYDNQFALNIDSSNIKAGMTVRAMWVEPITPVVPNSYKIIPQQDLPPVDAGEGDLWFDTSDNTYQGTVFDSLNSQLADNTSKINAITTINIENFPRQTGETTDDGRFTRAISALSGKAGKIIMPALSYTISQPIILNGFRLCGDSKQTVINYTGSDAAIKTPTTGFFYNGEVSNVNIQCSNTSALAMSLMGFHMSRFSDIQTNAPIYVNGDNGAYYNLFENIYVYALNRDYGVKIESPTSINDKMTSTTFINVHVFGYTGGASTLVKGFHLNNGTGLQFIKCYAEGCTEGFYSNNGYNNFLNCSVETSTTGFELTSNATYNVLIGCYAFGATTTLINNATNTLVLGGGVTNTLGIPINFSMVISASSGNPFLEINNGNYKRIQIKNQWDINKTFLVTNLTDSKDLFWSSASGVLTAQGILVPNFTSLPTASVTYRGQIATVQGNGTTTADTFYICLMSATGTYSWKQVMVG
jgi:hypothetical protein